MIILAIETSCDETSASVTENGTKVLSNVIASSLDSFADLGGVIPETAARKQVECIMPVISEALHEAKKTIRQMDAIAVTKGPGLLVSLLVGTTAARTIGSINKIPVIGVHHTMGHLSSTWLERADKIEFPVLALTASGGHSELRLRRSHTKSELIGSTRDDSAGEAFDKGALMLSLPYPGGPQISKFAQGGQVARFCFPRPLHGEDTFDFSFSGIKTSLKYLLRDIRSECATQCQYEDTIKSLLHDIAASYQEAICGHLASRIRLAVNKFKEVKEIHLVGGVSANTRLREIVISGFKTMQVRTPVKLSYCTDNAAMIGCAAYFMHKELGNRVFEPFETAANITHET